MFVKRKLVTKTLTVSLKTILSIVAAKRDSKRMKIANAKFFSPIGPIGVHAQKRAVEALKKRPEYVPLMDNVLKHSPKPEIAMKINAVSENKKF